MSVSQLQMGRARERKEEVRRKKETALESSFPFYSSVQAWMGKGDLGASQAAARPSSGFSSGSCRTVKTSGGSMLSADRMVSPVRQE